jgi:cold shock CspA family protein
MSIPGKVLIAVLSALAVSLVASTISDQHSLSILLPSSIIAAVLAVILSHRALPMPSSLQANGEAEPARNTGNHRERPAKPRKAPKPAAKRPAAAPLAGESELGTVKWFNGTKGFGFIIRDNGEEIFVHHRSIQGDGRRSLQDGAKVRYRVAVTEKGPQAEDVEALG